MRALLMVDAGEELYALLREKFAEVEFVRGEEDPSAEVALCGHVSAEWLERHPALRWLHVWSAGVNHLPLAALCRREILLTNSSGVHGPQMAEHVLGKMLAFASRLPELLAAQQRGEWIKRSLHEERFQLEGQTLLVIGLGGVGGALARKAHALGMRVLGVRRTTDPTDLPIERLYGAGELEEALTEADHIALCLPLTEATHHFLGEPALRRCKQTAYVYNVGRGQSIDQAALIRALTEGWIAGAGLDVTDPEPLPPEHPLWKCPNLILTQHTSGWSPHNARRIVQLFAENLGRYLAGEPLANQVNFLLGY